MRDKIFYSLILNIKTGALVVCSFIIYSNSNAQFKDLNILTDTTFRYYADENQQYVYPAGKVKNGTYRLYSDSILVAYVEIENNKMNGAYILFNGKEINQIGLIKDGKRYGIWIYFYSHQRIQSVTRLSNEIQEIIFGTDIEFLDKKRRAVKRIPFAAIIDVN